MESVLLNSVFEEISENDIYTLSGGVTWSDVGFGIVTGCGTIIGGIVGTIALPGLGTVAGVKGGAAVGGLIGGALFGSAYVLIS